LGRFAFSATAEEPKTKDNNMNNTTFTLGDITIRTYYDVLGKHVEVMRDNHDGTVIMLHPSDSSEDVNAAFTALLRAKWEV